MSLNTDDINKKVDELFATIKDNQAKLEELRSSISANFGEVIDKSKAYLDEHEIPLAVNETVKSTWQKIKDWFASLFGR